MIKELDFIYMIQNKIYFENLTWNWLRKAVIIIALLSLLIGNGMLLNYENKFMVAFGHLIILFFLWEFLYKNYVGYDKSKIYIRFDKAFDRSIAFKDINQVIIDDDKLNIQLSEKDKLKFDLTNIKESSREKLLQILLKHLKGNFTDNRCSSLPTSDSVS